MTGRVRAVPDNLAHPRSAQVSGGLATAGLAREDTLLLKRLVKACATSLLRSVTRLEHIACAGLLVAGIDSDR